MLPDFIKVIPVEDHVDRKDELLWLIDEMVKLNKIELNEKGYLYDFNIPQAKRTYQKLLEETITPYVQQYAQTFGNRLSKINLPWFQQYFQGSDFGWHTHNGHFAVVYYVELPDPNEATEFLHYGKAPAKEGDLLLFPTFLVHRSPEIESNKRKTIIACNVDFMVDREYIGTHIRNRH